jgi:hypothetical protein
VLVDTSELAHDPGGETEKLVIFGPLGAADVAGFGAGVAGAEAFVVGGAVVGAAVPGAAVVGAAVVGAVEAAFAAVATVVGAAVVGAAVVGAVLAAATVVVMAADVVDEPVAVVVAGAAVFEPDPHAAPVTTSDATIKV